MYTYEKRSIAKLLPNVQRRALTEAEKNFVVDMTARDERYGDELVLSDRHMEQLVCIANPNCPISYGPSMVETSV